MFSQRRVGDAFCPDLGNRVLISRRGFGPQRALAIPTFFGPAVQFRGAVLVTKWRRRFGTKKWRNNITYIMNSQICVSRIPTFFGTKTTPQNWNAEPKNLNKRDAQKRMRKLPQQIKNAAINLIAETHQVWYALGYRWRDVLANSLLMYSGCARRHETHAPIRADVHPRSAPRVRVHVHMSIREYTNAAHEAVWFICARIVTRGATTAGASQR